MSSEVLLAARGLCKHYGGFQAVRGVDFDLPRNSFVTILGPSGCGKTTILRMIGGFEAITSGTLEIDGRSLTSVLPNQRPVNTVFQNYALFPHLSAFDNVAFGLRLRRLAQADVERRVGEALATVRMEALGERFPVQLSGGQQQRVALARAFINQPRLLLLDEPLGALDLKMRRHMQVELKDLQRRLGLTFLYVTHDQEEAFALSDRIIVMNDGLIEQQGTSADIYYRPVNAFVADFIGGANLIPGRAVPGSADQPAVATALGTIHGDAATGLRAGETASICIRTEQTLLNASADETAQVYRGQVRHVIFQGSSRLVEVDIEASGVMLMARVGDAHAVEPGDTVAVALPRQHIRIVRGSLDAAESP